MKNKEETVLITAVDNGSTVELEINTTLPHEETKEMLAGAVCAVYGISDFHEGDVASFLEALYGRISPAWFLGKGIGGSAAEKLKTGGNPLLMARGKRGGGSWEEKNILKAWVSGRPGALSFPIRPIRRGATASTAYLSDSSK